MNIYETGQIRNVVFLGHGGAGKTTLVEAMAYATGVITRQGKVTDGNTISDFDKEEIRRKISINSSIIPLEWENLKINILDTPGYFDFAGQAYEAISVADAAVIVINGKAGLEPGAMRAFDICEKRRIPRLFFVTGMDDLNADYGKIIEQLKVQYGKRIAPFHLPLYDKGSFNGFVNVVKMGGRRFNTDGTYEDYPIPKEVNEDLSQCREMILEAVAETDDVLMDKFFNGEEFTQEEISLALRKSVIDTTIVPVQMGSGINTYGTNMLLQSIEKYFPSPDKSLVFKEGKNITTGELVLADKDESKPVSAYVFKTIMDPYIGKYSLVKVCTGTLNSFETIYNQTKEVYEKLNKLYVIRGKNVIEVDKLNSGDIGAIGKLAGTRTGDTLSTKEFPVVYHQTELPKPYTFVRYAAKNKGEEDKIAQGLLKLSIEDSTLKLVNDEENKQMLLYGIGEQQLEVAASKLEEKFKVSIELMEPRIAYKETIKKKVKAEAKYKKQSGGHGQYGHVVMEFEPTLDYETSYEFKENVFGGSVPKNYFPAVEKGVAEAVLAGPIGSYPVVGIKATLLDGSYHPVDSSEMAFKTASIMAFKKGFMEAEPILLEPIVNLHVIIPEKFTGDILGDINKRRGRVIGISPLEDEKQVVEALVPISEITKYSTELRSMTGGIGEYEYQFKKYEEVPQEITNKILTK